MLDTQARWNIIEARKKGTLTMQQLNEEIEAAEYRLHSDQDGVADNIDRLDGEVSILVFLLVRGR